jgi:hypothetical protein
MLSAVLGVGGTLAMSDPVHAIDFGKKTKWQRFKEAFCCKPRVTREQAEDIRGRLAQSEAVSGASSPAAASVPITVEPLSERESSRASEQREAERGGRVVTHRVGTNAEHEAALKEAAERRRKNLKL